MGRRNAVESPTGKRGSVIVGNSPTSRKYLRRGNALMAGLMAAKIATNAFLFAEPPLQHLAITGESSHFVLASDQLFSSPSKMAVRRSRAFLTVFFKEVRENLRDRRTMISAFLTALAGTFYTQYIYFIDPATAFSFNISIEAALVSIVGGIGTLWGPVVGTILLETTSTLLQSWLGSSIGGVQLTVYSLILIAVILWRPTGLMGMIGEVWQRIRTSKPARA